MRKLKFKVMLVLAVAVLASPVIPGPALAGPWEVVDQPVCMDFYPADGRKLTIRFNKTCGNTHGHVTFKPAGHNENVTVNVNGMGKCIPHTPDWTPTSYVILTGRHEKSSLLFQLWLRATPNGDKWDYTAIDKYDLRLSTWYKQPEEIENYKGGGSQLWKCSGP